MNTPKNVMTIMPSPTPHWVGDGFPVSSIFSTQTVENLLSPYLLFDYAGPVAFEASDRPRGVDTHPHRGFETVTIVYQGELEHRDSGGNHGSIGPGDVQWMTAAAGVLHEEKHSAEFTRNGGVLEMAQLWVNLPAKHKMDKPRYQTLSNDAIPVVQLPDGEGEVRIIAGSFGEIDGAAQTVTPVILWDGHVRKGARVRLPLPENFSAAVFVRSGSIWVGGKHSASTRQLAVLEQEGGDIFIDAEDDSEFIVVGGEPIDEPIVAHGPFVMNSQQEIHQALKDIRAGRFGTL
jgi:redox-sensitive bicupin YhaK (pirin superfamily)